MVGFKDHTKVSITNIIKPAMEALPACGGTAQIIPA
jgi:hypothetical protein